MKTVTMYELKRNLSSLVGDAAAGQSVLITRHGRPVASLTGVCTEHLHLGTRIDNVKLEPLFRQATRGRYLEILEADRHEREAATP
ncbi:type II toxin-antitoxin system Phd/YefM family antitoxin [Planctomycetota bacterium]